MPWTAEDAHRFKKGLNQAQAENWATIANATLRDCKQAGHKPEECEGFAVRTANSRVG